jgi:hypothetical protein
MNVTALGRSMTAFGDSSKYESPSPPNRKEPCTPRSAKRRQPEFPLPKFGM